MLNKKASFQIDLFSFAFMDVINLVLLIVGKEGQEIRFQHLHLVQPETDPGKDPGKPGK